MEVLDEAIRAREHVTSISQKDTVMYPDYLDALAQLYLPRYDFRDVQHQDLDNSTKLGHLAIDAADDGHHDQDLDNTIKIGHLAVDATDDRHPLQASRMRTLANGYDRRYQRIPPESDYQLALEYYTRSLDHASSPPLDRLVSGKQTSFLAIRYATYRRGKGPQYR